MIRTLKFQLEAESGFKADTTLEDVPEEHAKEIISKIITIASDCSGKLAPEEKAPKKETTQPNFAKTAKVIESNGDISDYKIPESDMADSETTTPHGSLGEISKESVINALRESPMTIHQIVETIYGERKHCYDNEYQKIYQWISCDLRDKVEVVGRDDRLNVYGLSKADRDINSFPYQVQGRLRMERAKELIAGGMGIEKAVERVWEKPAYKLGVVVKMLKEQLGISDSPPEKELPAPIQSDTPEEDTYYRHKSKHDVHDALKKGDMHLDEIISEIMGPDYEIGEPCRSFFKALVRKSVNKEIIFAIKQDDGKILYSLTDHSQAADKELAEGDDHSVIKEKLKNALEYGECTIHDLVKAAYGGVFPSDSKQYRTVLNILGDMYHEGKLGRRNDGEDILYFIDGAEHPIDGAF